MVMWSSLFVIQGPTENTLFIKDPTWNTLFIFFTESSAWIQGLILEFQNSIVKSGPQIRWRHQSFSSIKLNQPKLRLTRVLDHKSMKISIQLYMCNNFSCLIHVLPLFGCYIYICRSSNCSLMGMIGSYVHLATLRSEL